MSGSQRRAPAPLRAAATLCLLLGAAVATGSSGRSAEHANAQGHHECDVLIAGGSLASAAAAVAAGEASNATRVCFLEITDWPGGQASAGGIPAMDFGLQYLNFPSNIPRSLAELLTDGSMGGPRYNPGECAYLPKCFAPEWAAAWVLRRLAALPNVAVFLNTAVVGVDREASSGRVSGLSAVQRSPTAEHPSGWDRPLSQALPDWYSPAPSAYFNKTRLRFAIAPAGVVVEATEFGDVLVLADGLAVGQGIELGAENGTEYDESTGNAASITIFASWGKGPLPPGKTKAKVKAKAKAGAGGTAQAASVPGWLLVRRYWTQANHTPRTFSPYHADVNPRAPPLAPGDHYTVTSGCNDHKTAQVFLPLAAARATASAGDWAGGINLTAVAMVEQLAWKCYAQSSGGLLSVRPDEAGTSDGVAKMLYLRESRRSMAGVGGFRLCHNVMAANGTGPGGAGCSTAADPPGRSGGGTGYRFLDTVAIGAPQPLFGFDVHFMAGRYPGYMANIMRVPNSTVPYYIPFRALTVAGAPNVLVAGKSMATSFLANSVTRLHPNEWASGTAAGAAAAMMSALGLSSAQVAANVTGLQDRLRALGVPLAFTLPMNTA